jgi:hypothetical protein
VLPVPPSEPELDEPLEPLFDMTSIFVTSLPEKLARTWSPSLMSESDAGCPFFVTWVDSLTLRDSVSSCFDLSNFCTLPVISLPIELEAVEDDGELLLALPDVPALPVLELDEPPYAELPIEPVEPVEPLFVESLDELPDVLGLVLEEPPIRSPDLVEPEDVEEPVEPVPEVPAEPLVCAQAGAATSSPAVARPATLPHSIFIFPLHCSVGDGPGTLPWSSCWLPVR